MVLRGRIVKGDEDSAILDLLLFLWNTLWRNFCINRVVVKRFSTFKGKPEGHYGKERGYH
jgi:hypothetical protein